MQPNKEGDMCTHSPTRIHFAIPRIYTVHRYLIFGSRREKQKSSVEEDFSLLSRTSFSRPTHVLRFRRLLSFFVNYLREHSFMLTELLQRK